MNKKKQISQKIKAIKKSEFYDFKKAINLVGKKLFGDDWLFENHMASLDSDHARYVRTLDVMKSLIQSKFFDTFKDDKKKFEYGEEVFFFKDPPILNNYKIPKDQLDYVLENHSRFCDKDKSKFPRVLIYTACFGRESGGVVIKEFNERETAKIRDLLLINDFTSWLEKDDLNKEDVLLVLLGINPEYYKELSIDEKNEVSAHKSFVGTLNLRFVKSFIDHSGSSIKWQNNWIRLIKDLYNSSLFLNLTFSKYCKKFITHAQENQLFPTYFDKYLDISLYRPNYDAYFNGDKTLDHQDAVFLVMGLEPEFAKKYYEYCEIISSNKDNKITNLNNDEKVFFYHSYHKFLEENSIFFGDSSVVTERCIYRGDLEKFILNLHNKGILFDEYLQKYLKKKKKELLIYNPESSLYRNFDFLSQMRYWKIENILNIIYGKHPLNSKQQLIFTLGSAAIFKGFGVIEGNDKKSFLVASKSGTFYEIETINQFYPKEEDGYRPQDVLEWLIKHTVVIIPDLLVDLTFKNAKTSQERKKLTSIKKIIKNNKIEAARTGRPTKVDYPRVWEIFITEILEGEFDKNNSDYPQQAKTAFDGLETDKQNKLLKNGRSNLALNILCHCSNKTEIGRTMITDNIITPFEAEFSNEFFR